MERRAHELSPGLPSRQLLARVRDVMAAGGSAQERLDRLVTEIATGMKARVCSVYLLRAGEVLELFATEGLKSSAVHVTRMRLDEGLVGDIAAHARPLALSDAPRHARFSYRPETGEDPFQSFMGVPILREGRVLGVLAVQNIQPRRFTEEELETLQTVAMVLAELVAAGELVSRTEVLPAVDGIGMLPLRLDGTRFHEGVALGVAVLHDRTVEVARLVADDPQAEHDRLARAVSEMHDALDKLLFRDRLGDGEHREILETYRMIAEDAGWLGRIREAIDGGLTAEAALRKVQEDTRRRMGQINDPYIRERIQDLDDLAMRLLRHLTGDAHLLGPEMPDRAIIVARTMGPAELLDYDPDRLAGLILEQGSANSHVVIVAKALDIPVLGHVKGVFDKVAHFDPLIIDADSEQLFVRPADDVRDAMEQALLVRADRQAAYLTLRDQPAVTRDGVRIALEINAGMLADLEPFRQMGVDGIGLYRTEIPFMVRDRLPDVTEQTRIYSRIYEAVGDKPVTFRTLDAGGDKVLSYWDQAEEENPAMGWRALRLTLDRPAILRQQLRALIRASNGGHLRVMFPMVSEVAEFDRARALLDQELAREFSRGHVLPSDLSVGTMLEVPALLFQLPQLLKRVDFISIGTNDLMQFLFAADRGSPQLSRRYDVLSQAALSALGQVITQADAAGKPVTLCGEVGGVPVEAMALIGIGLRRLSVAPFSVGPVKAMIRAIDTAEVENLMRGLLRNPGRNIRAGLTAYAKDHGVPL